MLAIESAFAAPVSCSAIRKSEAVRTPRASPFGMSSVVGLPAPMQSATWSKPVRERVLERQRAAEAHAAVQRELAAALEQQADQLEEVLVPAHGDAVLGDAAEARHHALVERLVQLIDVADRARTARACRRRRRPRPAAGSGSIFRPSMPTTVWPSFIRWCARLNPAGPMPTTSTR